MLQLGDEVIKDIVASCWLSLSLVSFSMGAADYHVLWLCGEAYRAKKKRLWQRKSSMNLLDIEWDILEAVLAVPAEPWDKHVLSEHPEYTLIKDVDKNHPTTAASKFLIHRIFAIINVCCFYATKFWDNLLCSNEHQIHTWMKINYRLAPAIIFCEKKRWLINACEWVMSQKFSLKEGGYTLM